MKYSKALKRAKNGKSVWGLVNFCLPLISELIYIPDEETFNKFNFSDDCDFIAEGLYSKDCGFWFDEFDKFKKSEAAFESQVNKTLDIG